MQEGGVVVHLRKGEVPAWPITIFRASLVLRNFFFLVMLQASVVLRTHERARARAHTHTHRHTPMDLHIQRQVVCV